MLRRHEYKKDEESGIVDWQFTNPETKKHEVIVVIKNATLRDKLSPVAWSAFDLQHKPRTGKATRAEMLGELQGKLKNNWYVHFVYIAGTKADEKTPMEDLLKLLREHLPE